ncbi:Fur family transcriptional regulator [Cryptosporangium arvum]|uniref:Fe2+/Zn2+ uptake regulation protein n=1 Tax=Cryptosporangium arvum DSM 44712 TaxID=927661 RepID=A0A010YXE1_9ACTN|nr:Fur family transcriptional regulator [Cryptosporangium arvum]EXG79838.1 Fe2+/Zn2+ uptake regulation protein [Cryptosporangium arvum DSM 44712]
MVEENTRAQLRDAGLRVTAQRASVLDALRDQPHVTADAVARWVREHGVTISTQGVYDVLDALTAVGLTRRIEPAGSPAVYEARVGDNHHHLVCRTCGTIVDVDCVVGSSPCLTPADSHGFAVDEAEVVFWGVCPECLRLSS